MGPTRKWFNRIAGTLLLIGGVSGTYFYFSGGYYSRPELPEGSFSLSFKNGFQGIMVDIPEERLERRYLGVPFEVPFWAEDAWSYCKRPTKQESAKLIAEVDMGPGSRLEAICTIQADDATIVRGAVFSVPRL